MICASVRRTVKMACVVWRTLPRRSIDVDAPVRS
jgi:hypothetical protein